MSIPRAVAVVLDTGKVLVIKRYLRHRQAIDCVMCEAAGEVGPDCRGHHYAVLPGGHVEPGETAEEAALRELDEETTLSAKIDRLLWTGSHNGRPAHYFLMADVQGTAELSGDEAAANCQDNSFELLWADLHALEAHRIHPTEIGARLPDLIDA
ncbi:NUDIX domain-containing protein [Kribbella steppae]|nr:NUDIX domain-containing protein [Kribbella steppae]